MFILLFKNLKHSSGLYILNKHIKIGIGKGTEKERNRINIIRFKNILENEIVNIEVI